MIDNNSIESQDNKPSHKFPNLTLTVIGLLLLVTTIFFYPDERLKLVQETPQLSQMLPPTETNSPTAIPASIPTVETISQSPGFFAYPSHFGTLILSIREGKDIHLFLYQPFLEDWSGIGFAGLPLTRITNGPYQDITPSVSPNGTKIAFASNRKGPWDIYILDLLSGETQQYTDTATYDSNPTWSPDGQWLAYESYQNNNLEILIQDIDKTSGAITLTNHPGADYSPSWSGQGRWISYISDRNGVQEVWYADLDSRQDDNSVRVANLPGLTVKHPTWTSDGRYLTWAIVTEEGNHSLVTWDSQYPDRDPIYSGSGDWPLWTGNDEILYTIIEQPYENYLAAYPGFENESQVMMPAIKLPGPVEGISWREENSFDILSNFESGPQSTALWEPEDEDIENLAENQKDLIHMRNLVAPYPQFSQDAIGSFSSLRQTVKDTVGWDFLSTLENAYVPLEYPLTPNVNQNWLFTGRGISLNDRPRMADWLILVREEFSNQTFWRVYLRANTQQGLSGKPLQEISWDFNARYSGNNNYYENGGARSKHIQDGYWVDFTELAEAYGWKRFPAETYWQFSESASRYQYFAFTQGLNLETALLQLYPAGAIQNLIISANP